MKKYKVTVVRLKLFIRKLLRRLARFLEVKNPEDTIW